MLLLCRRWRISLHKLPKISSAMERGELSYSKARALTRVACKRRIPIHKAERRYLRQHRRRLHPTTLRLDGATRREHRTRHSHRQQDRRHPLVRRNDGLWTGHRSLATEVSGRRNAFPRKRRRGKCVETRNLRDRNRTRALRSMSAFDPKRTFPSPVDSARALNLQAV